MIGAVLRDPISLFPFLLSLQLIKATAVAYRRGVRVLAPEDLLFLIRHDTHRSSRLKEFLSWKDVRKNAKPAASANSTNTSASAASTGGNAAADDLAEINEEDARQLADATPTSQQSGLATGSAGAGALASGAGKVQIGGPRRRQLCLFWELESLLTGDLLSINPSESPSSSAHHQRETLRRLRQADLLTQSMSQQEYMEYSECRQASFTYKKARKFREWLTGGTSRPGTLSLACLAGGSGRELARLTDEALEILGFLAYELVQRVTEVGLAVKWEMDGAVGMGTGSATQRNEMKRPRTGMSGLFDSESNASGTSGNSDSNATATSTTTATSHQKTPLLPIHIEEAYRRLQVDHLSCSGLLRGGLNRKRRLLL